MSDKFNSLVARLAKQLPPTALQEPITGYLGHHDEDDPMLTDDNKYVYFRAEDPEAPEVDKALISQRLLRVAEGYLQHNMKLEIVRTKKNKFRVKDLDINDEADNFALTPLESNVQIGSGNLTGDPITLEMGGTGNDLSDDGPGYLAQLTNGAVVTNIKCNFSATVAPDEFSDSSQGYSVGSYWYNTTADTAYTCMDASVGAAVWKQITGAAPDNAKYWVSQANSTLTDEVNLGALGDGILYNNETGGVSTPSIATSAEIVNSITDGTFPAAKLVANSITASEIAANAIGSSELADNAVDANAIQTNAVTTAKILDANVTDAKIATLTGTKLRGTANRLIQLKGTGTAAEEIGGTNTGDIVEWSSGGAWAASRPPFGEMVGMATLGGAAASIGFTDLTLAGNFDHLMLLVAGRTTVVAGGGDLYLRFNSDAAAANYYALTQLVRHSASVLTNEQLAGVSGALRCWSAITGGSAPGSVFGILQILIHDYRGTGYKNVQFNGFALIGITTGLLQTVIGGGIWLSSSAVTRIDLFPDAGMQFAAGTRTAIYGIGKG
jgi:hypothetical protein